MKLVVAWLAALAIAVISATSCSINHRSGDYECTLQTDCEAGRLCIGNYCVLPGGGPIDAPKGDGPRTDGSPIDGPPANCPAQCTSCDNPSKTCVIDCNLTNCTGNAAIVCPTGWGCKIGCTTNNSCVNGVNCNGAKSCEITCTGQGSCRNIECGTGDCDVKCQAQNSCRGIDCGDSCACDVSCAFNASCEFLTCSDPTCDPLGRGCSSNGLNCDTCP
jgi:hypothetical protein